MKFSHTFLNGLTLPLGMTNEPSERKPLCFRGLANDLYYVLELDRSRYANYAGTGNTLNGNIPLSAG